MQGSRVTGPTLRSRNLRGGWKMAMVADRDGLIVLIADFHRANVQTIIIDPELDGSGGKEFALTEFMALATN